MVDQPTRWRSRMPWTALALSSAAVVVVTGFLVLWALPLLLTRAPSDGLSAAQRLSAVNDVRATLVTFLIAVGAVGSLVFTARTFLLSRETQVTDRYTRAVSQIGDSSLEVRVGGIYALERIGKDSAPDRPTIVYVLGAFVRHRSKDGREADKEPAEDVYTALRAISRLAPMTDVVINLGGADLRNANLRFMRGVRPIIRGADLTGASLPEDWKAPVEPPGTTVRFCDLIMVK
jgi:hypothetical protein